MRLSRRLLLRVSSVATVVLLGCAFGSANERKARTAAAAALECPEDQVELKPTSSDGYYATGCAAGVDLVCASTTGDVECKPGTPSPLTGGDGASEFCQTYETPASVPEAPSKEEFAALPHQGMLSQGLIREQVDKHMELIQACFDCAEHREKRPSGSLTVHLFVMPSGRVGGISVRMEPLQDEALAQCITNVVDDYEFPPPGGNGPFLTSIPFDPSAP